MAKYRTVEKSPDRPFKRRYKDIKKHKHLTHVIANVSQPFWEHVRTTAKESIGKKRRKKILPSSFETLAATEFPRQFNAKLAYEEEMHNDHTQNFHKGGGLSDAVNSTFSMLWNNISSLPGGSAVANLFGTPESGEPLTALDKYNADMLQEAYKQDFDSRAATIHGWVRIPKFDSPYLAVYWSPDKDRVYASVRGSVSAEDWLYHDVGIVLTQHPGKGLVDEIRQELIDVVKEFPDSDLTLNSHSLGGAVVTDAFMQASTEDKTWLDNFDHLNYYNAGSSPIADLKPIKDMLENDARIKLFINKSDMISQAYNQARPDETPVTFAEASWNPASAHGMDQWASKPYFKDYDLPVKWGDEFYTDFNNSTWDEGKQTEAALATVATPDAGKVPWQPPSVADYMAKNP
jgi:hypothetical protein